MRVTAPPAPLYDAQGRPLGRHGLAFTAEQADAVLHRDGPMLLSANAGSGKTAVLAERFVRSVVEDGIAPGALLAITFTEKAAGELRSRIRERFVELGARDAARDMDSAWISTIHGFCARVLRAHAVTAGLDPAFVVLDEATARQARAEAFTVALAAFLAPAAAGGPPPAAQLDLVATWGVDRLHQAIADVHDELRSRGATTPALPPCPPPADLAAVHARLRAAHLTAAGERAGWRTGLVSVDAAAAALDRVAAALQGPPGALACGLAGLRVDRRAAELKTPALDDLRAAITQAQQAQVDAEAVAVHGLLDRLLGGYATAYAAAKRARSAVDYDDLELFTKDVLERSTAVAAAYAERFARIMVDEFQDTNPLQMRLLAPLDRGNVFLVGDALQSIYGFRHADVDVFRHQRRRHEALGAAPVLATNWRSRPSLLHTVNAAFGPLHEDYAALVAGRPDPGSDASPRVELLLVDDAHDEPGRLAAEGRAGLQAGMPQARTVTLLAEARAVAARVRALVDAGECEAGEVAVLLRAAADLHVFERALELEGLATLASGGRGYWLRQQVQDLTSYLAALANPVDEPALLAVLASPLVGVSSDGLALIARAARARGHGLWAILTAGPGAAGLSPADAGAITAFRAWFAQERAVAPLTPLDRLITRVVQRTDYDLHVLRLPGARRRLANIHKLERLAADFEASRGRDVRAFIDHVAAEIQAQAREPEAPVELGDLDAVQLMTIHAAKGLEFGVVVVAGLGRQGQSRVPDVLVDGDRVGLRLVRLHAPGADALDYADLRGRVQAAQVQEERRVMHVAFTRARERLIISGAVTVGRDLPAERPGGIPLGWIVRAIDPGLVDRLGAAGGEALVERHAGPQQQLQARARLVPVPGPVRPPAADPPAPAAAPVPEPPVSPSGSATLPPEQLALTIVAPTAAPARGRRARAVTDAPDGAAPPPATVSYSSLEDHAACGYRYYLRRVLGLPDQDPPAGVAEAGPAADLDPRVRGTLAHALLELEGPAGITAADVLAVAGDHGVALTPAGAGDLLGLVLAFGATPLATRVAAAVRVRREEPFAFALDDADPGSPLVTGVIDLDAVLQDGTWLVVDYKTNQVSGVDLGALVERAYATQRRIYALAALRAGAPRVQVAYVFLQRAGEPVISEHTAAQAPSLTAGLVAQAAALRAGRFSVSARPHRDLCLTCPGRGGMCSWPQEMSLRAAG